MIASRRCQSASLPRRMDASTAGFTSRQGWMWMWTSVMRVRAPGRSWFIGCASYHPLGIRAYVHERAHGCCTSAPLDPTSGRGRDTWYDDGAHEVTVHATRFRPFQDD